MALSFRIVCWHSLLALTVPCLAPASHATAQGAGAAAVYEVLRSADVQLATMGYRLSVAGAPLCDRLEPATGMQLHTLAQYPPASRDTVRAYFKMRSTAGVQGVVAGSPADGAGLRADDSVLAINGSPIPAVAIGPASTDQLVALHRQIAVLPPATPIVLDIARGGANLKVQLRTLPACPSRFELRIANAFDARANGELVQISSKYFDEIDAELLPVVVAHELSHNILRHRERLAAKGADFGLASGFGRNVGLFRQTEIEADILAVHLLARAGYDPRLAARFWREAGPEIMAGMIRSRSHPALSDRVAIADYEAAKFAGGALAPPPSFATTRTLPLTGEWRTLLPPALIKP